MHPELLVKAISAIDVGTISTEMFQSISGISSGSVANQVLSFLATNGIGVLSKTRITFLPSDRLRAALVALETAECDTEDVAEHLSWRDFEGLASEILTSFGYRTKINVRLKKPRMEIDVVGLSNSGFAILVDCKHWKRSNFSSMPLHSRRQVLRAEQLMSRDKRIKKAAPVIVTLHAGSSIFAGGVPVVPIARFPSFLSDVEGHLSEIYIVDACPSWR